ncbi:MAG: hypothetical protein COA43_16140 [Robiginitomaculum sp.]|nr:MAG: hypothetical protein COA43_16140 [Robiginitomaculum sp.]
MFRVYSKKDIRPTLTQMPNAAWSWEYLRRNENYLRDWRCLRHQRPDCIALITGGILYRENGKCRLAEKWGLLFMADPTLDAVHANVFWKPRYLPSSIPISLSPIIEGVERKYDESKLLLCDLKTRRVLFETIDRTRHIRLCGERFWIQLFCKDNKLVGENGYVSIHMLGDNGSLRTMDSATQLLSLYRNAGGKIGCIGRVKNPTKHIESIIALDIHAKGGSFRDIAVAFEGVNYVRDNWFSTGCRLKDRAKTCLRRGQEYVDGKYLELLTKKTL